MYWLLKRVLEKDSKQSYDYFFMNNTAHYFGSFKTGVLWEPGTGIIIHIMSYNYYH